MNIIVKSITIRNEELLLTNQRALYWAKEDALILSDLHIGKTAHFRKHGIPMPNDILQADLERLKILINHFNAHKLIVVGDLFHAEINVEMETFKEWLNQFNSLKIVLIKGNHDRMSERLKNLYDFDVFIELITESFHFIHEPHKILTKKLLISGHIHPGVLIRGKGRQSVKLPCYQLSENQLVLPAFSLFTGLNTRFKMTDSVCFAFTESQIFDIE